MKDQLTSLGYVIKTEDEYSTELKEAEQTAKENHCQS